MYRDTITLFCRRGALWYPTVLDGVNLNLSRSAIIKEYGEQSADNAILNVHLPAVKPYLPPKDWQAVEDPQNYITFTDGQKFDFFWMGEWDGTEPISDSDYGFGSFYDYMNKNEDYVYAVTSCAYFSVIPHLEVTGK